jgi:predicted transposase YbfD/YdcC
MFMDLNDVSDFALPRSRVAVLLDHFSELGDEREPERVMYPLSEVLFLVTCATICSCDDFDDIVEWGEANLDYLRRFSEFHFGIPCERWLRILVNRIDPVLFAKCFDDWIAALWPGRHDLIAIDGKTARRTGHARTGAKPLHTLSAYASAARLTLAEIHLAEKGSEITAIPDLLDVLAQKKAIKGALVTIDAIGTQVDVADKIVALGADFCLPLKGNQPTLADDVRRYFDSAPKHELESRQTTEKGHGRLETRTVTVSGTVDWIASDRSYPGRPKFKNIKSLIRVVRTVEQAGGTTLTTQDYIASAPPDPDRLGAAIRAHWAVESMHWMLDVLFKDDLSTYRSGHGAKNMAVIRRFALGLVRAEPSKRSVKTKRKKAGWNTDYLNQILQIQKS